MLLVDCFFGVAYLAAGTKPTTASAEGTKETDVEAANEEDGTEETIELMPVKTSTATPDSNKWRQPTQGKLRLTVISGDSRRKANEPAKTSTDSTRACED
jgi:hypothetical protein